MLAHLFISDIVLAVCLFAMGWLCGAVHWAIASHQSPQKPRYIDEDGSR
jgi:hypothetical protein